MPNDTRLPLVIHPDVANFLQDDLPSSLSEQIWRCLERLRQRDFSSGSGVKKLRGCNIWEARINQASRLIFSYYRSFNSLGKRVSFLAIQDLCLDHDDVNRDARRARNLQIDSGWWYPEEGEWLGSLDRSLTEEEREQLYQEAHLELIPIENLQDELMGSIDWRVVDSPEEWSRFIENRDVELPLKLSQEEYELVHTIGNILLSGSAGTGKTTVGIYRLWKDLQDHPYREPRLYVAYNPLLVSKARELFEKLRENLGFDGLLPVEFKSIREVCLEILRDNQEFFNPDDEVTYSRFDRWYKNPNYPPSLAWDEIRSVIKGSQLSTERNLLSRSDYQKLRENRLISFSEKQQEELYKIANWYQTKLKNNQQFDEIDLAREALKYQQKQPIKTYRSIVCDEVQDLARIQLELLIQLVSSTGNLFFTGDKNQMISPSGFRWETLKDLLYNNGHESDQKQLFYNFRNIQEIGQLANQVLKTRARLLGEPMREETAQVIEPLTMARLVDGAPSALFPSLQYLNPGDVILVRTEKEREKLKSEFGSQLIFTIEEAKGLEFDTVFLVDFFTLYRKEWDLALRIDRLERGKPQHDRDRPRLELELNLLYVAITRSRRCLYIWEQKSAKSFWSQPEVQKYLVALTPECVSDERQLESDNWGDRGEYYLQAEFYQQAAECFERAGEEKRRKEALARHYRRAGEYGQASTLFEELQNWSEAGEMWSRVDQWLRAAECWERAGNREQQMRCLAQYLETQEKYADAAEKWQEIGEIAKAAEGYGRAQEWEKAEQCCREIGDLERANIYAIKVLEKNQKWQEAARRWHAKRRYDNERVCWKKAAECHRETQHWQKAIEALDRAIAIESTPGEMAKMYQWRGDSYIRLQEYTKAMEDFTRALELQPDDEEALSYRALLHLQLAWRDLHQARKLSRQTNNPRVYHRSDRAIQALSSLQPPETPRRSI